VITAVLNLFVTPGETVLWQWGRLTITREGLVLALSAIVRLVLLIMTASLLTLTTSPIILTDGMERLLRPFARIGLPAHELALMMTIALRFIPTLAEEMQRIIRAQAARGGDFTTGGLMNRLRALIPVLVPLFVAAFRRADELATAMEARGYRGGEGRTRMKELAFTALDPLAAVIFLLVAVFVLWVKYGR
jgi:energy-coupling factor transport system permease protein